MSSPRRHAVHEVSLGTRPSRETQFVSPGDPQYEEIARLDAFAFRRYLDRVFWYPRREVVCFEVRAVPSRDGKFYDVVAVVAVGEGEAWFSADAVPDRWDFVALSEIMHGLSVMEGRAWALGREPPGDVPRINASEVFDSSRLEDPDEAQSRRWAVINRLREASRQRRAAASGGKSIP